MNNGENYISLYLAIVESETLQDPSNGYLVDDSCVFGAEVFVLTHTRSWESLSLVQPLPIGQKLSTTWEIENFTKFGKVVHESNIFTLGGREWYLRIYPNGYGDNKGKAVSLYLMPSNWAKNPTKAAVYVKYKLRILDRVHGKHAEHTDHNCFGALRYLGCGIGIGSIISLKDLQNPKNGFMVKDRLSVEVEFLMVSETKNFSESTSSAKE
ncbi:E3 ubiquitin-protein ligase SIN-like [Trema orientale]|uniref:E3 ubiquitin-protein ligase SIN-like n=1 Tax=Trema orientale TaxID=63057 RepID=A0A2P5APH2_TREOI|nr:E3 ubiquitin-protein ligase SIN-like [Trema orientale]